MFQQQLVASEQQMPRHPTAINPPTGREPAAPSLRHHHGDGHWEHTDEVKVGWRHREWSLHRRVSPSVSPCSRLFSSACPLRTRQDNQLGPSVCGCVCVFTPDCYGRMWWFSSKPECLRKMKWLPVRIFTFSVNVLKWNLLGKKHRKPSSLDSSSGSSVSSSVWPPATKTQNDRKADKQIIHQRVLIMDCVSFHCENEQLLFHHIITKTSCLTAD